MTMKYWMLALLAGLTMGMSYGLDPIADALRDAAWNDRLVLVEFASAGSAHSRSNFHLVHDDPAIAAILRRHFAGRRHVFVSAEKHPTAFEEWRVTSLPTFIVLSSAGEEIARSEGRPASRQDFLRFLREALTRMEAMHAAAEPAIVQPTAPPAALPALENVAVIPWTAVAPTPIVARNLARAEERPAVGTRVEPLPQAANDASVTEGRFAPGGEREIVYNRKFTGNVLWTIELEAEPGDEDLDLKVETPDGEALETSEGGAASERIVMAAAAGVEYRLRVYAFRGVRRNVVYRLRESVAPLDADRLAPGAPEAAIGEDEEQEIAMTAGVGRWLRFGASAPGRYRVNARGAIIPAGLLSITAVTADGTILGRGDAAGFSFETVRGGGVYLALFTPRNLTAAITVTRDRSVNLDAIRETLRPDREATGRIGSTAGLDNLYRIAPPGPGVWIFTLQGDPEDADIDLEIIDGDGEMLERSEGPVGEEQIAMRIEAGEERIARVYVYRAENMIAYRLTMTQGNEEDIAQPGHEQPPAPVPPADAPLLTSDDRRQDSIGRNETRWFRVEPAADGLMAFFIEGEGEAGDIDLAIHRADGALLMTSQSNVATEAILLRVERGRPLFARVYAYGESEGGRFRIWFMPAGR